AARMGSNTLSGRRTANRDPAMEPMAAGQPTHQARRGRNMPLDRNAIREAADPISTPSRLVPFAVAEGSPRKIKNGRLSTDPPPDTELTKETAAPTKKSRG